MAEALARETAATPPVAAGRARRRLGSALPVLLLLVGGLILLAAAGPRLVPAAAIHQDLTGRLMGPTAAHWTGTDALGRDELALLVLGSRWSLLVGGLATALGALVGIPIGLLAAWQGGWVEAWLMRLVDAATAFPFMVLAVAVIAVLHRGFLPLVVTLGLGSWLIFARASYVDCRRTAVLPYVEAARALGAGSSRILIRHVLPNMSSALMVIASFTLADLVIAESGLSFLGLGAPPGIPSWGVMLADGRGYMESAWWLIVAPGVAIAFTVVLANFLGDALEARFNPRSID